jgi:hypothetical protein
MLQITNLHAAVCENPILKGAAHMLLLSAAMLLAACGNVSFDDVKEVAAGVIPDVKTLTEQLPPETRVVVTSYKSDLLNAASAYKAEYGQLPASLADIASVAGARETAVDLLADGIGEQIPFASRATVEKAANGIVSAAEGQILDQMRKQDAPKP